MQGSVLPRQLGFQGWVYWWSILVAYAAVRTLRSSRECLKRFMGVITSRCEGISSLLYGMGYSRNIFVKSIGYSDFDFKW